MERVWLWGTGDLKAPTPPHLRESDNAKEDCGNCRMFDKGRCWGYGNYPVKAEQVCDSWTPLDTREASKRLWAAHRQKLKEA